MNKPKQLVDMVINRLNYLGDLTSRSMFGGYGICLDKVMFSLVADDKFYLRANEELEPNFINNGMKPLIYMNRGLPIVMRYFHIESSIWEDEQRLKEWVELSLSAAIKDKLNKDNAQSERLKELPNITLSLERLLWRAGIFNKDNLFKIGAVKAFLMVKSISHSISIDVLFALAGAIEGCHAAALTEDKRSHLLDEIK
jgi:DNA transformation protein